jgi:ABC-2 type transport system permease protein
MNWKVIIGFLKKELTQSLRNPVMQKLLFIAPIFQIIIFGTALNTETRNIEMVIYGKPNDTLLQEFRAQAIASKWFVVNEIENTNPYDAVKNSNAEVVIFMDSKGLDHAAVSNDGTIQILIDATDSMRATAINQYVRAILTNLTQTKSKAPINIKTRILYNPLLKTSYFLIPGLFGVMACLITVLLTSMSFTREKEMGTMETIISAPIKKWEIIIGKAIPYSLLGASNMIIISLTAIIAFGMPFIGSAWLFSFAGIIFIISTVGIGIVISNISRTQQQAMMGSFLFIFPSFLLSGLMFPVENMPTFLKFIASINPMTHFNYIVRNIVLKGGDLDFVLYHTGIIFIIGILTFVIAFRKFKLTLN